MCGREEGYVKDAFDTNWIAPLGPHVNSLNRAFLPGCWNTQLPHYLQVLQRCISH